MYTRLFNGIVWNVTCPSHYELAGWPQISVTYLGDIGDGGWFLHVPDEAGEPRMQAFESREAACRFVASAFA